MNKAFLILTLFIIGGVWKFCVPSIRSIIPETPPCRNCAELYQLRLSDLPTVTFCSLADDPASHLGKTFRYRGKMVHDFGDVFLNDFAIDQAGVSTKLCSKYVYTRIDLNSVANACAGTQESLKETLGYKHLCLKHPLGFDGSAEIVAVGKFERLPNSGLQMYKFDVLCLERVSEIPSGHKFH
jgi:hypothetical protein